MKNGIFMLIISLTLMAQDDVISAVKRSHAVNQNASLSTADGNIVGENVTVLSLLSFAYDIRPRQLIDAPAWLDSERWDIRAKPAGAAKPGAQGAIDVARAVLRERFKLRVHEDRRKLPSLALVIAKGGSKLKPSANADAVPHVRSGNGGFTITSAPIKLFAETISDQVARPVVDRTGLTGRFDATITFAKDMATTEPASDRPSIYTALVEQLGLQLKPIKAPVEVLVIDHVERPDDN